MCVEVGARVVRSGEYVWMSGQVYACCGKCVEVGARVVRSGEYVWSRDKCRKVVASVWRSG